MGNEESGYLDLVPVGTVSGVFPGKTLKVHGNSTRAHYIGIEGLKNPVAQGNRLFVFNSNPGDKPNPDKADFSFKAETLEKDRLRINVATPGDHIAARIICHGENQTLPGQNSLVFVQKVQSEKAGKAKQKATNRPVDPTKGCSLGYSR